MSGNMDIRAEKILTIRHQKEFEQTVLELFRYQARHNRIYHDYIEYLGVRPDGIKKIHHIPFMPVEFFKSHLISTGEGSVEREFVSSVTTGADPSRHRISDLSLYDKSFTRTFRMFYGNIEDYCILALLPGYLERRGSSLVYMIRSLIQQTGNPDSGFYLRNYKELAEKLSSLQRKKQKILLFGISYALLDFAEYFSSSLVNTIVMETGGMKGSDKEITREELHTRLCRRFKLEVIHSEYGMTELLSQAYSKGKGIFFTPPWMQVLIRDVYDPFHFLPEGRTGGINIIDLANIHSVAFIETKDLGRLNSNGGFEVLGRFDDSDLRGCNLLAE